jgi:TonB-dependent starch-binding outer membrane protein SusC
MLKNFYNKSILVFLFSITFCVTYAQDLKKITGQIVDKSSEPIPFANVQLKGSMIGTQTDVDGNFTFNLANFNSTLVFSSIGFQKKEILVNDTKFLKIMLEDDYSTLEEAVVVGYGSLQKSVITGAISSVKNKDIRDQPVSQIGNALQGKLAGVNVVSPSGTPGAGLLFNIRGSFNPLYVVDGIPLLSENTSGLESSYDLDGNAVGKGQSTSSISDINPNDIESVEILKDASAAAIYGARAANGVVLITTKRGNSDRTEFGINHYTGVQQPTRKIKFLSSAEMKDLLTDAVRQDKLIYEKDKTAFDDISGFNPDIFKAEFDTTYSSDVNTVWLDQVLKNALVNNTEIFARGGSQRTRFMISGNLYSQDGIVLNSGFQRVSARLNLDHKVNDNFSIGNTLMLAKTNNRRSFNDNTYSGVITNALGASPWMPAYEDDEKTTYAEYDQYQATWLSDNPVKSANEVKANSLTSRVLGSLFADYKFSPEIRFHSGWSIDYTDLVDNHFFSPLTNDAAQVNGRALYSNFKSLNWLAENYFTYNKTFSYDHTFDLILGNSLQESKSSRLSFKGENFPDIAGISQISAAGVVTKRPANYGALGLISYYGRLNYDYKKKLILAVSYRVDGSSRFAKGNRFANFGSASVGYRVISDIEPTSEALLTDLKVRASFGTTGDQEIGDFSQRNLFGTAVYNGQSALVPSVLANTDLTWQKNTTTNLGVDFELKKGRIAGAIEAFLSDKKQLLFNSRVPGTTGFSSVTSNAGAIRSKGLELTLNATLINQGRFRWAVGSNVSFIKSVYSELEEDNQIVSAYSDIAPTHIVQVGQPVGTFWGIKYTGVDADNGDATFDDLNEDGEINNDDAQVIGHAFPKFFGGINTTLNYKRFDLAISSQFSYGNQVYNLIRAAYDNGGWADDGWDENNKIVNFYANNSVNMKKRWQKSGDVTNVPRASYLTQNYIEASSMFIEDASFLKIRTINLGYNFKHTRGFETARLYVLVQNPFTFTKYSGFDPEVSSTGGSRGAEQTAGVDYAAYPQARTYTFGLNMTF